MNRTFRFFFLWVSLFAFVALGWAQGTPAASSAMSAPPQSSAPIANPVSTSLRTMLQRSRTNTIAALSAMPADKFNYKPTSEQMTFAHLAVHISGFNNSFCAKAADVPAPKVEEAKETDGKDKLVAAVTASYDFCTDALSKMDDSKLGDSIDLFGGRQGPRAMAALILVSGSADHYSTAAMYLRLNGIVPPSAQAKK